MYRLVVKCVKQKNERTKNGREHSERNEQPKDLQVNGKQLRVECHCEPGNEDWDPLARFPIIRRGNESNVGKLKLISKTTTNNKLEQKLIGKCSRTLPSKAVPGRHSFESDDKQSPKVDFSQ